MNTLAETMQFFARVAICNSTVNDPEEAKQWLESIAPGLKTDTVFQEMFTTVYAVEHSLQGIMVVALQAINQGNSTPQGAKQWLETTHPALKDDSKFQNLFHAGFSIALCEHQFKRAAPRARPSGELIEAVKLLAFQALSNGHTTEPEAKQWLESIEPTLSNNLVFQESFGRMFAFAMVHSTMKTTLEPLIKSA